MRQRTQSVEDAKFRTALDNMRYKRCTKEDIAFLRTRISSELVGRPCVSDKEFRNIPIITANNIQKDAINEAGCIRFADETKQELSVFLSDDTMSTGDGHNNTKGRKIAGRKRLKVQGNQIPEAVHEALWNQPNSANSGLIPAKLCLAIGMPVMIRTNIATELCMTRGQEGIVHAWRAGRGNKGQQVLKTLFIKLTDPPTSVKFDGLPENVVPLIPTTNSTQCCLPDDQTVTVSRTQVEILPCFAMTEYASQGKTRPNNVVDLNNTRSHQGYYTALSRSKSAKGTLILQGFDTSKITGGASGALRQEFRELELLDEISELRYKGKLPSVVVDDDSRRSILINAFRKHKGLTYVPQKCHLAIRWNKNDPFLDWTHEHVDWRNGKGVTGDHDRDGKADEQLLSSDTTVASTQAADSKELTQRDSGSKHTISPDYPPPKKAKMETLTNSCSRTNETSIRTNGVTTRWANNSCAYDSVVSILFDVWRHSFRSPVTSISALNSSILEKLFCDFAACLNQGVVIDRARDYLRQRLYAVSPNSFRPNEYTSVHSILDNLLETRGGTITSTVLRCRNGHEMHRRPRTTTGASISIEPRDGEDQTLQRYVTNFKLTTAWPCSICGAELYRRYSFLNTPKILAFDLSRGTITPNMYLMIPLPEGDSARYCLRGTIYYGGNHFTARIVGISGEVWYHDGYDSAQTHLEGYLSGEQLLTCYGRELIATLYILQE